MNKIKIKAISASLLAATIGVVATPGVAHASSTLASLVYYPSTLTLYASGSTVGWTVGTINIRATLYANGIKAWDRSNQCLKATNCTVPTWSTYCPISGYWDLTVVAWRGSAQDSDGAVVVI